MLFVLILSLRHFLQLTGRFLNFLEASLSEMLSAKTNKVCASFPVRQERAFSFEERDGGAVLDTEQRTNCYLDGNVCNYRCGSDF